MEYQFLIRLKQMVRQQMKIQMIVKTEEMIWLMIELSRF